MSSCSVLGQPGDGAGAVEQGGAEAGVQAGDLLGYGWLGQIQPVGV
jgi:hypothetical protein